LSGDVIVTVTLNAALHVAYTTGEAPEDIVPVSRPGYRAGGRGVTVARVLHAFGHDVLAAGLAGGATGELIIQDLAKSGVPTAFTLIRGESRRFFRFAGPEPGGPVLRFSEPGPYMDAVRVEPPARGYLKELLIQDGVLRLSCSAWMLTSPASPTSPAFSRRSPSRRPSTGC
jgi:tagatose 6-phosphate kinase